MIGQEEFAAKLKEVQRLEAYEKKIWWGDMLGVAAFGPESAECYCVSYKGTRAVKIQRVGTSQIWTPE